ncbi:MAG: phage integrase N-terminal SAM-like domain-containing protein [Chloroflexi bacterium]|nr:phage integrase N-terminal SAM-like domain-containing protein [Chloroflexota bacterium]
MIGLEGWIERFCEWMELQNYSSRTVEAYRANLGLFSDWLGQRPHRPGSLAELDHELLSDYQQHLFTRNSYDRGKKTRLLSVSYRNTQVAALRSFFKFLVFQDILLVDPSQRLQRARFEQRLPVVLSEKEVSRFLGAIDISEPLGLRDRAIVELAYSTGMRRSELMGDGPASFASRPGRGAGAGGGQGRPGTGASGGSRGGPGASELA